jgi:S-layer homology domain
MENTIADRSRSSLAGRYSLAARILLLLVALGLMMASMPQSAPAAGVAQPFQLPQPVQVSPANGSNTDTTNSPPLGVPTFQWQTVSGAIYYNMQVSPNQDFSGPVYDITTLANYHTPTSADITFFPNQNTSYWRVRACDAACQNGQWSNPPWSFHRTWTDKPILQSPADGASVNFLEHPAFSWSAVPGARFYRLRIATDQSCSTIVQPEYATSEVEYNLAQRLAPGTYYWCVFPQDYGQRDGIKSDVHSFTYGNIAIPTLLSPVNNSQLIFTPAMSWTAVKGATHYLLQYDTSPGFNNPTQIDTAYTSYTPQQMLSNDSNWYWHVAAYDSRGVLGSYQSSPFTFRMVWNQLQPSLLTPNNNYYHVSYPYFQWTGVPDAREYELQIARTPAFNPLVVDLRTSATSYIVTPPQIDANLYYWRIITYGADGVVGATSATYSFKFDQPANLNMSSVAAQFYPPYAYNSDPRFDRPVTSSVALPLFQWQQVTSATNYIFTLGSTINMTDSLLSANTSQPNFSPNLSDNAGVGFNFNPSTIYYWRVQAQTAGGPQPPLSQVWAVRVNSALDVAPVQPSSTNWLQSPTDLQDYVVINPVFRWFPVVGANKYRLQVATDPNFSNMVQSLDTAFTGTALRQKLAPELYYWRVQAYNGNTLLSTTTANRLHIFSYVPYDPVSVNIRNVSGSTVATGTVSSSAYDISAVYATKTSTSYKLAATISNQTGTQVDYSFPLNLDYYILDSNGNPTTPSGAPADPLHSGIHFANEFRPEYVAKFSHLANGNWSNPQLYAWNQQGNSYDPTVVDIVSAGGAFTPTNGYVELEIPTGSVLAYRGFADPNVPTGDPTLIGVEAYSTNPSGALQDTVPDDPNGISSGTLGEFRSISDHPDPAYPFNTDFNGNGVNTPPELSVLYASSLFWYIPAPTRAYGFDIDFGLDRGFTTRPPGQYLFSNRVYDPNTGEPAFPYVIGGIAGGVNGAQNFLPGWPSNTFYWRVRICRTNDNCTIPGSWSKPNRFNKVNIKVDAPTITLNNGVPTFTWPRVEGAFNYQLDVASDINYNNTYDNFVTRNTSYTPPHDYVQQNYYYRVRASEYYYSDINQYTYSLPNPQAPFQVIIPRPMNLRITDPSPVQRSPTFAWDTVLVPQSNPVIQAASYQLQTSASSSFNNLIENVNTTNINWTPANVSYPDGTYFYRVQTRLSNDNATSDWTGPITFTKQYPLVNVGTGNAQRMGDGCSIKFTWPAFNAPGSPTQLSGIFGYQLETAYDANFNTNHITIQTNNASYTNYNDTGGCTYPAGQNIYWRVAMIDSYGTLGPADAHLLTGNGTPTPTWTPGGPTATDTPTWTPSGPTDTPTNTPTPFSATDTPTPTFTPGGPSPTACASPFIDVPVDYWAYNYIVYVYCHGVVNGVGGNSFAPNATATRAQFSRMVVKARGLTIITPASQSFTDVPPNYFAYTYIETAKLAGIVSGYTQAQCTAVNAAFPCFLPNSPVTRGAMAKFVVKAWDWPQTTPPSGQTFTDVPPSYAFYVFIETAKARNIIDGETAAQCLAVGRTFPCFLPNDNLTRAQLSKTLFRSMTYP